MHNPARFRGTPDCGLWKSPVAGGWLPPHEVLSTKELGSLSVGFHHARQDQGSGHSIFNGLALAICALHDQGLSRILCIDLDAHCGGGTYSIVGSLPGYRQLDVSLFPTDRYQPVAPSTLDMVDSSAVYLIDWCSSGLPSGRSHVLGPSAVAAWAPVWIVQAWSPCIAPRSNWPRADRSSAWIVWLSGPPTERSTLRAVPSDQRFLWWGANGDTQL